MNAIEIQAASGFGFWSADYMTRNDWWADLARDALDEWIRSLSMAQRYYIADLAESIALGRWSAGERLDG